MATFCRRRRECERGQVNAPIVSWPWQSGGARRAHLICNRRHGNTSADSGPATGHLCGPGRRRTSALRPAPGGRLERERAPPELRHRRHPHGRCFQSVRVLRVVQEGGAGTDEESRRRECQGRLEVSHVQLSWLDTFKAVDCLQNCQYVASSHASESKSLTPKNHILSF